MFPRSTSPPTTLPEFDAGDALVKLGPIPYAGESYTCPPGLKGDVDTARSGAPGNGYKLGANGPNLMSGFPPAPPTPIPINPLGLSSSSSKGTEPKTGLSTAPFPLPHLSYALALVF